MDPLTGQDARIRKAESLLKAAEFLFGGGYYDDCISRVYYAVYHMSVVALAVREYVVRDKWEHAELHKSLLDHFCKRGFLLNKRDGETFSELMTNRNNADYEMHPINRRTAEKLLDNGKSLVAKLKGMLR